MRHHLSLPFKPKLLFITGVVVLSFVASAVTSMFPSSTVSAKAATYAEETDLATIMKAIKYMNGISYCITGTAGFKTSISGDEITKGPRWWMSDGLLAAQMTIGKQLDTWGDKNGVTKCNGESDSEPGWISDALVFFGINVRDSDTNNRNKSLIELGYTCPSVTTGNTTCTNSNANGDTNTKGSVLYILRNLPYLKGANLVNVAPPDQKLMAATYSAAYTDYTNLCGATTNAAASNVATIYVVKNSVISQQKWGGGKASIDAGSGEAPLIANDPANGTGAPGTGVNGSDNVRSVNRS